MFSVAEQKSTESPPPLHLVGPIPEGNQEEDQQVFSKVPKEDFPMMDHPMSEVTTDLNAVSSATSGESSQVDVPVGDGRGSIIVSGPKRSMRSSKYHGVSKHRPSGRFEAYLWDNRCRLEGRTKKGRQVYLGNYDSEEKAARARDLATLKCNSSISRMKLNFPVSDYENELQAMKDLSQEEFVAYIRRSSSSFSRGASDYRGVTRGQKDGEWQARISQVGEVGDICIGTFKTEQEAAEAYDIAAIELRGPNAVTNFDIHNYCKSGLGLLEDSSWGN